MKPFVNGELIGEIENVSVDENGNIDVEKMNIMVLDMLNGHYRV